MNSKLKIGIIAASVATIAVAAVAVVVYALRADEDFDDVEIEDFLESK